MAGEIELTLDYEQVDTLRKLVRDRLRFAVDPDEKRELGLLVRKLMGRLQEANDVDG